jgi:hypothetical protein
VIAPIDTRNGRVGTAVRGAERAGGFLSDRQEQQDSTFRNLSYGCGRRAGERSFTQQPLFAAILGAVGVIAGSSYGWGDAEG